MLNRRILRIKVFKTIYAYAENPSMTLAQGHELLEDLCQSTRDLYLLMLDLTVELKSMAEKRINMAKSKFHPTEEEKNPNMKFVENGISKLLENDPDYKKILSKKKLNWDNCDSFIWNLYENVRQRDYFLEYMNDPERSLKQDAELFTKIFERELVDDEQLESILEDLSIWWNNDLAYALTCCCRTLNELAAGRTWRLPELYLSQMPGNEGLESDRDFVNRLFERAFVDFNKDLKIIDEQTPKWDINRVCTTDLALIICGMAEAAAFPLMPKKVVVNEYVEISKYFSTPESKGFVNGLLDNLIK